MESSSDFKFGGPTPSPTCCGKPRGCTSRHDGCAFLNHPWKRAMVFGDLTVRCQAIAVRPHPDTGEDVEWQCVKKHLHRDPCEMRPRGYRGPLSEQQTQL